MLIIVYNGSFKIVEGINQKLTFSLYLDEEYDKNSVEVIDLQNDIKKSIPEIEITYKTKEELLEEMRESDPELVNILERQNPLPETIKLDNIPLDDYNSLNQIIENKLFILWENVEGDLDENDHFSSYTRQFERIENITSIISALQFWLSIIILTFIVSIAVIVYSIIWNFIYYYRDEIYITRLVWGSKYYIYWPFSLQWMIYVFIAFLCALILFFFFTSNLNYLLEFTNFTDMYPQNFWIIVLIEFAIFLSIWALSGFLSSRKYISMKK